MKDEIFLAEIQYNSILYTPTVILERWFIQFKLGHNGILF